LADGQERPGANRNPLPDAGWYRRFSCGRTKFARHGPSPQRSQLVEAKEVARHGDVRMTMKYAHIGIDNQARALASVSSPDRIKSEGCQRSGSVLGVPACPGTSSNGNPLIQEAAGLETPNPRRGGGYGDFVISCHRMTTWMKSGGGGNCTRVPRSFGNGLYVCSRSFECQPRGPDRQGPLRLIPS
jgi:hypothetical protein